MKAPKWWAQAARTAAARPVADVEPPAVPAVVVRMVAAALSEVR